MGPAVLCRHSRYGERRHGGKGTVASGHTKQTGTLTIGYYCDVTFDRLIGHPRTIEIRCATQRTQLPTPKPGVGGAAALTYLDSGNGHHCNDSEVLLSQNEG